MMECRLCGEPSAIEFLNLGQQPLANKYPTQAEFAAEDFFPLQVFFCPTCKNVQLGTIISRERMFEDYYYLSSVNRGLVRHFEDLAQQLASAHFVVDVGSNDGILLKPLLKLGVKALGVEPSINVSKIANDQGFETLTTFFDIQAAEKIEESYGRADVIVASSVFTHLENPSGFIEAVKRLLTDDGTFIVEVEYIGAILATTQFERFYLDRIFYYSLTSLAKLLAAHGMFIADVHEIAPHGGSLQVLVQRAGRQPSHSDAARRLLGREEKDLTLETLREFGRNVDVQISAFKDRLAEYQQAGLRVAGYGSPARVATICNYGRIGPSEIPFTVDDSPLKQNKFTPGTHIPIVPKSYLDEHERDVLVVFAYEYFDDIKKKTDGAYRYLKPIPPTELK
ncbi:class I SAM-dependent methyltransferase [Mycobacterium fragae]|uniref:Methyltransferase n=2 Tax=Mycobacterium fragae TaxID=1260918 RepID=A0A1X1UG42_9MYCO|nr:class I SAM-dependent methyltransferase [Mycobacterium fragae]ORV55629.1 methyltransferase [Mycobacterium fragae]